MPFEIHKNHQLVCQRSLRLFTGINIPIIQGKFFTFQFLVLK